MICPECKKEIPDDKVFCPYCAAEIRFVPDYNVFEEDYLSSMISEEKKEKRKLEAQKENKKKFKTMIVVSLISMLFLVVIASFIYMYYHSYSYYITYAESHFAAKRFAEAERVGEKAIDKKNTARANLVTAKAEIEKGKDKEAIKHLVESIRLKKDDVESYKLLINLYYNNNDMRSLQKLKNKASTDETKKLFNDLVIGKVFFSLKEGSFKDEQELTLKTESNYKIYYTLDGSTPDETNGTKYDSEKPIVLTEGKTTVKAACIDSEGRVGKIFSRDYKITYTKPKDPEITPESGSFSTPTQVTISASANCRIFYTWDGTDPDINSAEYTGPINIPQGNNILSVIVIDNHDMVSNVVRQNYVYNP